MMMSSAEAASARRGSGLRGYCLAGALIGVLLALLLWAPASWLAQGLARASQGRLLLVETRGNVWQGSGLLVLAGGSGSRDASLLPTRLHWRLALQDWRPLLLLQQDCCINGQLRLQLGSRRLAVLPAAAGSAAAGDWQARFPARWLAGLGTPWNTLRLDGSVRLATRDFALQRDGAGWQQQGRLDVDLIELSSPLATLPSLGSYRFSLLAGGVLQLSTLDDGALRLSGQGQLMPSLRFRGEASAAPEREAALNNLLNIIGRRESARSIISIG